MAQIGNCWAATSWTVPSWAANTWADSVVATVSEWLSRFRRRGRR